MIIKILSLCAALLAPESTGLDPHGRSLHLPLHEDFNISYSACITTAKQARKYNIDPFVATALMYKTTKFSPKLAKKRKIFRVLRAEYGCAANSGQFIRSSCSPFMLYAPKLASILQYNKNRELKTDYRKALRIFLRGRRKAKVVENMAGRFADVYSRTHTYYTWVNPFFRLEQDPELDSLVEDLNKPQPYDNRNHRIQRQMERNIYMLSELLGFSCRIEAKHNRHTSPEYYIRLNGQEIYDRLSGNVVNARIKQHSDGVITVKFFDRNHKIYFIPHRGGTYIAKIHKQDF